MISRVDINIIICYILIELHEKSTVITDINYIHIILEFSVTVKYYNIFSKATEDTMVTEV